MRRRPSPALAVALLVALSTARAEARGTVRSQVETAEQLQTALLQNHLVPRAFVRGHQLRLYFTNTEPPLMFEARWSRPRLQPLDFSSQLAELRLDHSPPPPPDQSQRWRQAKVVVYAEWQSFAEAAFAALAPSQNGHGVYLQHFFGDAVVFRDMKGDVYAKSHDTAPPEITLDHRLTRTEAAAALARVVEAELQAAYPRTSTFLFVPPQGPQRLRLIFLDLAEHQVVVLLTPHPAYTPPGVVAGIGTSATGLASFLIVDHVFAILKNPVSTVGRLLNLGVQWPASLFNPRLRNRARQIPPLVPAPGMELAAWEKWLDRHTGTRREQGSLRLLIDGEQFYSAFLDRVRQATRSIDLQVCIFDRDDVAVAVADALKQQSTNTAVRVILDHNSSRASGLTPPTTPLPPEFVPPGSIRRYLTDGSQVHVRWYLNPFLTFDHSKVFLIDGRYGYLGGMNFGREYRYEWHDLMVEVEGPVITSFQRGFNRHWAHAGPLGDLAFAEMAIRPTQALPPTASPADAVPLRRIYTRTGRRQIRQAILEALQRAQNHVYLENPYLFDNTVIVALVKARLRGADVRVILPSGNDIAGAEGSNLVTANYLLEHGVRVYFYPGMTHVKALLVDGWACLGSANFNTLSLRLNQEANLATSDPGFAARLRQQLFEIDFEKSYELQEPVPVSWIDHLADSMLNHF